MREDLQAQYTVTSVMVADIFTKEFFDVRKWTSLSEKINVAALRRFDDDALQRVHHMFRNAGETHTKHEQDNGGPRMPPGCDGWSAEPGRHSENDMILFVAKEPKYYRVPD